MASLWSLVFLKLQTKLEITHELFVKASGHRQQKESDPKVSLLFFINTWNTLQNEKKYFGCWKSVFI